ncbi:hypothetical protein VTO73DRAFT_7916 [Trametes versicolor]
MEEHRKLFIQVSGSRQPASGRGDVDEKGGPLTAALDVSRRPQMAYSQTQQLQESTLAYCVRDRRAVWAPGMAFGVLAVDQQTAQNLRRIRGRRAPAIRTRGSAKQHGVHVRAAPRDGVNANIYIEQQIPSCPPQPYRGRQDLRARRPRTQFGGRATFADPRQGDPAKPNSTQINVLRGSLDPPRPLHTPYGFLSRPCVIRLRVWRVMGLSRTRTRLRMASCAEGASQPASWDARISSC